MDVRGATLYMAPKQGRIIHNTENNKKRLSFHKHQLKKIVNKYTNKQIYRWWELLKLWHQVCIIQLILIKFCFHFLTPTSFLFQLHLKICNIPTKAMTIIYCSTRATLLPQSKHCYIPLFNPCPGNSFLWPLPATGGILPQASRGNKIPKSIPCFRVKLFNGATFAIAWHQHLPEIQDGGRQNEMYIFYSCMTDERQFLILSEQI